MSTAIELADISEQTMLAERRPDRVRQPAKPVVAVADKPAPAAPVVAAKVAADDVAHDVDAPLVGRILGQRYQLDQHIGSGGMSDVYRATDLLLHNAGVADATVAIKVLKESLIRQADARILLLREAYKTRSLIHPNIIRVHDVAQDGPLHYIIMEWLDGESLDQVILRSRPDGLPLGRALKILKQVASALSHAHRAGIVHTDLKPANIMVTRNGSVRLFDFGVARAMRNSQDQFAADTIELTAPLAGYTPTYASPAVLAGDSPGVSDDLFAFACISYELLSSRHPYERLPADLAERKGMVAKRPSHIGWLRWSTVKRALSFNAEQRPLSIAAFMAPLERRYWPTVTASLLLIGCCAGGTWLFNNYHQSVATIQHQADVVVEASSSREALLTAPLAELMAALPALEKDAPLTYAGLLHARQPELMANFERQVDKLMTERVDLYPDFNAMEKVLIKAFSYYPDSQRLVKLQTDIRNSRQLAIEVLAESINGRLARGEYRVNEAGEDLFMLAEVLHRISPDQPLQPSDAARQQFIKKYKTAEQKYDVAMLKELLKIGTTFFANAEDTKPLISHGTELAAAIDALVDWQNMKAIGNSPAFPYAQAELFYQPTFNGFFDRIGDARTVDQLDRVRSESDALLTQLPGDFALITSLRKQLADRYLKIADDLLARSQVRTAQYATQQATVLLALVNRN